MKEEGGVLGFLFLVLILLAAAGVLNQNTPDSQMGVPTPIPPAWEQYMVPPVDSDVFAQLQNTQNLVRALGVDLAGLQTQNVGLQIALATIEKQLQAAEQQAKEESKRQTTLAWITTIVGALFGWLVGIVLPTKDTLSSVKNRFNKLIHRNNTVSKSQELNSQRPAKAVNWGLVLIVLFALATLATIVVFVIFIIQTVF